MVKRSIDTERRQSPPSQERGLDFAIAAAMLAVAWAIILWRFIHPTAWPVARKMMLALGASVMPKAWPDPATLVTVLYGCAIGALWWLPLRHAVRRMRLEAGESGAAALRRSADVAFLVKLPPSWSKSLWPKSEVDMRHAMIGFALLGIAFAPSVAAQPQSYSSSDARTLIASGELPIVSAMPLYFRVIGATLSSDEESISAPGNGVLYQVAGTVELAVAGTVRTLRSGDGAFVPGGSRMTLRSAGGEAATYLYFVVAPASYMDEAHFPSASAREIYRSVAMISNLRQGSYLLNLSRVTLPAFAPADLPHRRSGAALHYVISGFGAETANGITIAKGPGSISYEPDALVYQWGNPGYPPLTYLVFNLNPEAEDAVIAVASAND